jgi:hypothetical protein
VFWRFEANFEMQVRMILHPYRLTSEHVSWLSGDQALVAVLGDFATPTKRLPHADPKTSCNLEGA